MNIQKIFNVIKKNEFAYKTLKPIADVLDRNGFWDMPVIIKRFVLLRIMPLLRQITGRKMTKRLLRYKNCHKDSRIFIIASGPSVREADIQKMRSEITIGVNQTIALNKKIGWKPTYYCVSDPLALEWYWSDIMEAKLENVFWGIQLHKYEKKVNFTPIYYDSYLKGYYLAKYHWKVRKHMRFSADVYKTGVYAGGRSVSNDALQLAVYMGAKEIYLYGHDCDYSGKAHFDDDEEVIIDDTGMEECLFAFYEVARKYCDEHGIKVYNATRGGKLEIFDRVDIDDVLETKTL